MKKLLLILALIALLGAGCARPAPETKTYNFPVMEGELGFFEYGYYVCQDMQTPERIYKSVYIGDDSHIETLYDEHGVQIGEPQELGPSDSANGESLVEVENCVRTTAEYFNKKIKDESAVVETDETPQTYTNTLYGYQVQYPADWKVGTNGSPDSTYLGFTYFYEQISSSVRINMFSEKGTSYQEQSEVAGAVTGELNGYYYVINIYGPISMIADEDFQMIVDSFAVITPDSLSVSDTKAILEPILPDDSWQKIDQWELLPNGNYWVFTSPIVSEDNPCLADKNYCPAKSWIVDPQKNIAHLSSEQNTYYTTMAVAAGEVVNGYLIVEWDITVGNVSGTDQDRTEYVNIHDGSLRRDLTEI